MFLRNLLTSRIPAIAIAVASLLFAHHSFAGLSPDAAATYGRLPLRFERNLGQTDKQVRFTARGAGYSLFLTGNEAVLSLRSDGGSNAVVRMKLAGAKARPRVTGVDRLPGLSHYFIGDSKRWRSNVPGYSAVSYAAVYPGIELVFHGSQRQLEYDFVVAPGANPQSIAMSFGGVRNLSLDRHGNLVLATSGEALTQHRPVAYQEVDGTRVAVDAQYVVLADRTVRIRIGRYDASRTLVIDPVLSYATYLGGGGNDVGHAIALDGAGNTYITGETNSTNFPGAAASAIQSVQAGSYDVFVSKLNAAGTALVYSTYLGGSGGDFGYAIAVDPSGSAYITGETSSPTIVQPGNIPFPRVGEIDATYNGGGDVFFTKLNAAGDAIVFSTYYGGTGVDRGYGVAVDTAGVAYFTGSTNSIGFPTTASPLQGINGGSYDAFVVKLTAAGDAATYSTYLGGNGSEFTSEGGDIAIDAAGNAYVGGTTASTNFPGASASSIQPANGGGFNDGWVAKLNAAGNGLTFSTYYGGNGYDSVLGIALDGDNNIYFTGFTDSTNFSTAVPIQASRNGTAKDAFIVKLNSVATGVNYSTYLGGTASDTGYDIVVDASGRAFISGVTSSTDFPTASPLQALLGGGSDMFVSKLNALGNALAFSTYLGGSAGSEDGQGIAIDTVGNVYVAGSTGSSNFPATAAFQTSHGGSATDAFVVKIAVGIEPTTPTGVTATAQPNANVLVTWSSVAGATSYEVYRACYGGLPFVSATNATSFNDINAYPASAYVYWVRAVNATGSSPDSVADLATTIMFTDDPLVALTTVVKAAHMQELRSAVNTVRVCADLPSIGYLDVLAAGTIKVGHIQDLRVVLDEALSRLGLPFGAYGGGLTSGMTVRATHFATIRATVR